MKWLKKIKAYKKGKIRVDKETVTVLIIGFVLFTAAVAVIFQSGGYGLTAEEIKNHMGLSSTSSDSEESKDSEESEDSEESKDVDKYNYENNNIIPGNILDCNGKILCDFSSFDGKTNLGNYIDSYMYSPLLGWMNLSEKGSSGLINKYYRVLRDDRENDYFGKDIYLTINHELQKRTYDIFNKKMNISNIGSAIVMDAESGEILSCLAFPSYDANSWVTLINNGEEPNQLPVTHKNAILPASTFKIMSSILVLENNKEKEKIDTIPFNITKENPEVKVTNVYGSSESYIDDNGVLQSIDEKEKIDYIKALNWSSNVYFSKMMLNIDNGYEKLHEICGRINIGEDWELDFGSNESVWLADSAGFKTKSMSEKQYIIDYTPCGQDGVKMSTVTNAMIGAAIINGGKTPVPHMIKKVVNSRGVSQDLDSLKIKGLKSDYEDMELTTKENAEKIYNALLGAALNKKRIGFKADEKVAAKSGTAEIVIDNKLRDCCWLLACKEINGHKYVVVVNQMPSDVTPKDMVEPVRMIFDAIKYCCKD